MRTFLPTRLIFAFSFMVGMGVAQDSISPTVHGAVTHPLKSKDFQAACFIQLKTSDLKVIQELKEMGFNGFRRGFYWKQMDSGNGQYDFSSTDEMMNYCREHGIFVLGAFFQNNPAYEDDQMGGIQSEKGRKAFAAWAAACALRYKDYPVIWEIWNEPNVRTFWRSNKKSVQAHGTTFPAAVHNSEPFALEYTALVKEVGKQVKAANPDAVLVAGSVSNYWNRSYEWMEFCFKAGILEAGIDAWSVHPYGVKSPEDFKEGHEVTRNLLKKYGHPDMPMLNTERGFAIDKHEGGGEVANEGFAGGNASMREVYQAWHFVRQYMIDQQYGLRMTSWYQYGSEKFGLSYKGEDRLIKQVAPTMIEQMKGYEYVQTIPTTSELNFALLFKNADGNQKVVVWTSSPPKESPDSTQAHEVTLKIQGDGKLTAKGMVGEDIEIKDNKVELDGAPIYLEIPAGTSVTKVTGAPRA